MKIQDIFNAADRAYATALADHTAAVQAGQEAKPPVKGVTMFATMYYGDIGRIYSVVRYRILGQPETMLEVNDKFSITPAALDAAAAACGYKLEYPPLTGYTHHLVYRGVETDQPTSGYSAQKDQWAYHNARKRQEEAIMEAGRRMAIPPADRIQVVNVRSMEPNAPGIVYCGRAWAGWHESPLHNPHHAPEDDHDTRIKKFKATLWQDMRANGPMRQALAKLQRHLEQGETVNLGCWCAPRTCHCDTIKAALVWLLDNPQPPTPQPPAPPPQPQTYQQRIAQRVAQLSEGSEQYNTTSAGGSADVVPAPATPPALATTAYRLIVAGSRNFTDYALLTTTLDAAKTKLAVQGKSLTVLCGMAAGADLLGKQWADANDVPVKKYPADWTTHGKAAGYRRNEQMAEAADGLLAFWDGASPGTRHMIETARKRGLAVKVITFTPPPALQAPVTPKMPTTTQTPATPPKAFVGDQAFLSNFHPARVVLDGEEYPSVEAAYQAAKTTNINWRATIRAAKTPGAARRLGKSAPLRPGWNAMRIAVMRDLLNQKFSDPTLKTKLIEVAKRGLIIEYNTWHDNFWGACQCADCAGKPHENHLGQLMMEIAQVATVATVQKTTKTPAPPAPTLPVASMEELPVLASVTSHWPLHPTATPAKTMEKPAPTGPAATAKIKTSPTSSTPFPTAAVKVITFTPPPAPTVATAKITAPQAPFATATATSRATPTQAPPEEKVTCSHKGEQDEEGRCGQCGGIRQKDGTYRYVCATCNKSVPRLHGLFVPTLCKECLEDERRKQIATGKICRGCKQPFCDCCC